MTDEEFQTHIVAMADENWCTENGRDPYANEADYAEMLQWAEILRQGYDTGEYQIYWRS